MANPTVLRWTHDHRNTDGTPFTAEQFAGFELGIAKDGSPVAGVVSIPAGYDADGGYEMPLADLAAVQENGNYTLQMRVVNRAGNPSAFSAPASFTMDFRVPTAPTGLSVG